MAACHDGPGGMIRQSPATSLRSASPTESNDVARPSMGLSQKTTPLDVCSNSSNRSCRCVSSIRRTAGHKLKRHAVAETRRLGTIAICFQEAFRETTAPLRRIARRSG